MHLFHESAEESEIEKSSSAEAGAVGGRMHVGDVRADGEVNRDRDALFVSSDEDARIGIFYIEDAAGEELARCFAVADVEAGCEFRKFVDVLAGFAGHAELAFAKAGFDVFGSVAREGDFKIVDEGCAIHGDTRDKPTAHEVDQDRAEANFDDVAADAPEDGGALFAGSMHSN